MDARDATCERCKGKIVKSDSHKAYTCGCQSWWLSCSGKLFGLNEKAACIYCGSAHEGTCAAEKRAERSYAGRTTHTESAPYYGSRLGYGFWVMCGQDDTFG